MTSSSSSSPEELELGLGLSIGRPKTTSSSSVTILTAKDFPSPLPVSGTKRNADSSPPRPSQVVGWPPVRASRMYSLVSQAKTPRPEDDNKEKQHNEALNKKTNSASNNNNNNNNNNNVGFVKVNIDGNSIGRKVDLNAHSCYDSLAQTLHHMFFTPSIALHLNGSSGETTEHGTKTAKLLDGSSEFVLTYEDKDGDWMLVGDVPWRMFLGSVKRLRIMRTSEATGLAPRFQDRNERQRMKPI